MPTTTPLIWTTHGNIPIADLEYRTSWEDTPEYTKFTEMYFLGDELVKASSHVFTRKPLEFITEQSAVG